MAYRRIARNRQQWLAERWERLRLWFLHAPGHRGLDAGALEMEGPFPFFLQGIAVTAPLASPGNFALGHRRGRHFLPGYVGRADRNLHLELQARLHTHSSYSHFMFSAAPDSRAAFEKQCRHYHRFRHRLENRAHPRPPADHAWRCPHCLVLDPGPAEAGSTDLPA